jgi:arylsulfatase A-like enzyme
MTICKCYLYTLLSVLLFVSGCGVSPLSDSHGIRSKGSERPNVLLIVVDDLGYADLGVFGSEIETPNLDRLANEGVLLTQFYVAPACSPTRAMLLSGTDSHIAGLGNMAELMAPNQEGQPGYEGHLNFQVAALPELFKEAGYRTYMTGKWHLGMTEATGPAARGFDKSFALLPSGAGHFGNRLPIVGPDNAKYSEDGEALATLPEDFYSTRTFTERLIDYIDEGKEEGRPFFGYLAYSAPHWPLQAPEESIAKYRGKYDAGYDVLLEKRLRRLKELGFVGQEVETFPRLRGESAWDELSEEEQRYQARVMETYAAMVDDIDVYVGKLIDHLKSIGEYDNTLIVFQSDNGPEAHNLEHGWEALENWVEDCCNNSFENIGAPDSYVWYGPNWGQAGNTPLRMFKGYVGEGGVRAPAFFHFPKEIPGDSKTSEFATVKDVMPTLLEFAGIDHPGEGAFQGREVVAMQGHSLVPLLTGKGEVDRPPNDYMGWELVGKRAIRQGEWTLVYVPYHEVIDGVLPVAELDKWQLYNLADDPAQIHDLSESHPEKRAAMLALWDDYVERNNVILPNRLSGY